MNEENNQKVIEFCSISGADPERAEFFLRAAEWDVGVALSTYFENDGQAAVEVPAVEPAASPASVSRAPAARRKSDSDEDDVVPVPESYSSSAAPTGQSRSSRIQTFANWGASAKTDNSQKEDSDDDDQGQAYYAGGSDTSGQQILGPPRKNNKSGGKVVSDLFKAARERGAEERSESGGSAAPPRTHFAGTGYRLGESESEASQSVRGAAPKKRPMTVILRLWKTGFTVNDEPLRSFHEPQNRQFLDSIRRGEIPEELLQLAQGGEVALDMEDHSSEDYVPPKQHKVKSFSGAGQTLGSEATQPSTSSIVSSAIAQAVTVDSSQPVTNIQIRLADGSRLVCKFNHTHTVGDVRRHIAASRPQYAGVAFSLITTLPSRQLTDDTVTLKEADLLNAAIMQKL